MYTWVNKPVFSRILTTFRIECNRGYLKKRELLSDMHGMGKNKGQGSKTSTVEDKKVQNCYLEVLGTGAPGMPSSVIFYTNNNVYLINCGEGTIKLASEYKLKFHRTPTVFITYPSWQNIAGLVGLGLTAQDANATEYKIYGHKDMGHIFSSLNKFIVLKNLKINIIDCISSKESIYKEEGINIKTVILAPSSSKNLDEKLSVSSEDLHKDESEDSDSEASFSKAKKFKSSNTETNVENQKENCSVRSIMKNSFGYIFNCNETPGKLIVEKCVELGVPAGPLLGVLKNGEDVTLENGVTVRSADVMEPPVPGATLIAVECPSEDYLDSLLAEPAFMQYQTTEDPATAVIHFSKSYIVKHEKYKEWLSRFSKRTLHLFINDENNRSGSVAIHRQQYKLHLVQPELFPLLDDPKIPAYPRGEDTCIQEGHKVVEMKNLLLHDYIPIYRDKMFIKCESNSYIHGETLLNLLLKPKKPNYDYTRSLVLKRDYFLQEIYENEEDKEKCEESIRNLRDQEKKLDRSKVYPKIIFLGTGSSKPSKVRNGSGILVFTNESDCIMFDCAESSFLQLVNFYGLKKARKILRNLHAIFVSHMHIDHHWGLITLLKERKIAFDEESESGKEEYRKIFILAPMLMNKWLNLFCKKFEEISDLYYLIPNSFVELYKNSDYESKDVRQCKNIYDFSSINTIPVHHCHSSYGISISHKSGWKITYSGDTRPCENLIVLGRNSDILIHEATFEDAFSEDAKGKLHSTIEEAIKMGMKMNAKFTLLTHFSQRYSYLPNTMCLPEHHNIGIAFDFMEVPYYMLPLLPALIKPLQLCLSKYDEYNKAVTEMFLIKQEKMKFKGLDFNNFSSSKIAAKIP